MLNEQDKIEMLKDARDLQRRADFRKAHERVPAAMPGKEYLQFLDEMGSVTRKRPASRRVYEKFLL